MIYEGLRVRHYIRKEFDPQVHQCMVTEVFVSGMFEHMMSNICNIKLGYQVLLWTTRFSR